MKKGFTLIDMLVFIIIIGIFSIPAISTNQKETRRKELFITHINDVIIKLSGVTEEELEPTIDVLKKGKNVECENIILTDDNEILLNDCSIDKSFKKYCYYNNEIYNCKNKEFKDLYLSIGSVKKEPGISTNPVIPDKSTIEYVPGTLLQIEVGQGITNNFYVLSETSDTVTVIMDRNLGENVAWGNSDDTTSTLANEQLTNLTSNWENAREVRLPSFNEIVSQTSWYQNLSNKNNYIEDFATYYSIILNDSEASSCNTTNEDCRKVYTNLGYDDLLLPTWLDINLNTTGYTDEYYTAGYWLSDIRTTSINENIAWLVDYRGQIGYSNVESAAIAGVRPVVTINKSHVVRKINTPVYIDGERN